MPELPSHRSVTWFLRAAPFRKCHWGTALEPNAPHHCQQSIYRTSASLLVFTLAMCMHALAHINWVFTQGNQSMVSGFPSSHAHMTHSNSQDQCEVLFLHQLMKPSTIPAREASCWGREAGCPGPHRNVCPQTTLSSPFSPPPGDFRGDLEG